MPCNSDYLEASGREKQLSKVACLLDELAGKSFRPSDWDGYHPRVYCKSLQQAEADVMVAELCEALQQRGASQYSLEMQMWWRDHQAADAKRLARERETKAREAAKAAALSKLTPAERDALGIRR